MLEDGTHTFAASEFGFSDPNDSPANSLQAVIITTLPTGGTLTLDTGGGPVAVTAGQAILAADITGLVFKPTANANGLAEASFTFQGRDDGGTPDGGQKTHQTPNTITFNVTP